MVPIFADGNWLPTAAGLAALLYVALLASQATSGASSMTAWKLVVIATTGVIGAAMLPLWSRGLLVDPMRGTIARWYGPGRPLIAFMLQVSDIAGVVLDSRVSLSRATGRCVTWSGHAVRIIAGDRQRVIHVDGDRLKARERAETLAKLFDVGLYIRECGREHLIRSSELDEPLRRRLRRRPASTEPDAPRNHRCDIRQDDDGNLCIAMPSAPFYPDWTLLWGICGFMVFFVGAWFAFVGSVLLQHGLLFAPLFGPAVVMFGCLFLIGGVLYRPFQLSRTRWDVLLTGEMLQVVRTYRAAAHTIQLRLDELRDLHCAGVMGSLVDGIVAISGVQSVVFGVGLAEQERTWLVNVMHYHLRLMETPGDTAV